MAITRNLIVVIQNEPRDGDIVYLMESEVAYKERLTELGMEERDTGSEVVELGYTYVNEDDFCTMTGHEVQLPYEVRNVCPDCFFDAEQGGGFVHEVGEHMIINFVPVDWCNDCAEE